MLDGQPVQDVNVRRTDRGTDRGTEVTMPTTVGHHTLTITA